MFDIYTLKQVVQKCVARTQTKNTVDSRTALSFKNENSIEKFPTPPCFVAYREGTSLDSWKTLPWDRRVAVVWKEKENFKTFPVRDIHKSS